MLPLLIMVLSDMDTFFTDLIYGPMSFWYVGIFIGLFLMISYRVKYFSLVGFALMIFQMLQYLKQTDTSQYINQVLLLGVSTIFFCLILARDLRG